MTGPASTMPIVEFVGLPGSGKTTIARALHRRLVRAVPTAIWGPDLIADDATWMRRVFGKAATFLRSGVQDVTLPLAAARVPQPSMRDRLRSASTVASVVGQYAAVRRAEAPAILDQGAMQAAWTVGLRGCVPHADRIAARLLGMAAAPDVRVIHVASPTETCYRRLVDRTSRHSRLQYASGNDAAQWTRAERLLNSLLREYEKHYPDSSAIKCDGEADTEVVVDLILSSLSIPGARVQNAHDRSTGNRTGTSVGRNSKSGPIVGGDTVETVWGGGN